MKMAPVIGPVVTCHHTTGKGGDLSGSDLSEISATYNGGN